MVISDKFLVHSSWWSNWKYPNNGTQEHLHCTLSQKSGSALKQMRTKPRIKKTALCQRVGQSVQSLSRVRLFVTPRTATRQDSMSITYSWSLPKLMSIELVMPSNHLILCRPLLLPHSAFPIIRIFSTESVLLIRWPKYWSFSFSNSPSNEYLGLISFRMDWLDLLAVQGTL